MSPISADGPVLMPLAQSRQTAPRAWLRPRRPWRDPRVRALAWQALVIVLVGAAVAWVATQASANLRERNIASGFGYLDRASGFELARGPVPYSSRDTYARALALGVANTLRVSLLGIAIATVLGAAIGLARLSTIWIASAIAGSFVEIVRNTPLLLQLFVWYTLWQALPGPHDAIQLFPGAFACSRGLFLPVPAWHGGALVLDRPLLTGFDFHGGLSISPEFASLLAGLATYTAAFIGETVRGSILAVDRGQTEAAAALGLSRVQLLRLVVLPQAVRSMIPPLTSQFVNLAKNSSLGVAIGYPDLISVTNTTLNLTGQAVEAIAVAMAIYLAISVALSFMMQQLHDRCDWRAAGARIP
jgi:general L-amino acid transport system permease protein